MKNKRPRKEGSQKLIDSIVEAVESKLGERSLMSLGDETVADVKHWLPTGSSVLDKIIGKGIPVGRIIEIFGPEATGKSTLGMNVLKETQKLGGVALMIDTEVSYDSQRAKSLGIDTDMLLYSQVDTMEQVFDVIEITADKVREKDPECFLTILWDSISATTTKQELESELGASHFGIQAKILSQGFRMFRRKLARCKVTLLAISQVRINMSQYGSPYTTTGGGMALKHNASVRLELMSKRKIQQGTTVTGVEVRARTKKNKVYSPFRECFLTINFMTGIDDIATSLVNLVEKKVIKNVGGWCYYKDMKKRAKDLEQYFREHEDELRTLIVEQLDV